MYTIRAFNSSASGPVRVVPLVALKILKQWTGLLLS